MSRRRSQLKREVLQDPVYKDVTLARFVNKLMLDGKKNLAQRIVYQALDELGRKVKKEQPLQAFKKALDNCKPALEARSRRVGGATYQVPVDVRPGRRMTLAMAWLIDFARKRNEKTMALRLAGELEDAYFEKGNAIKKKEDVHRMADANKAFSHYNWGS